MGCTYTANTVLGLRIDYKVLEAEFIQRNTRVTRGCDHEVPEGQKFCSECGAEREVTLVPKFYFSEYQEDLQKGNPGLVVEADDSESPSYIYIGFGNEAGEYGSGGAMIDIPELERIESLKDALRKAFIPMGLWDTRNFGLWTFLYVGC